MQHHDLVLDPLTVLNPNASPITLSLSNTDLLPSIVQYSIDQEVMDDVTKDLELFENDLNLKTHFYISEEHSANGTLNPNGRSHCPQRLPTVDSTVVPVLLDRVSIDPTHRKTTPDFSVWQKSIANNPARHQGRLRGTVDGQGGMHQHGYNDVLLPVNSFAGPSHHNEQDNTKHDATDWNGLAMVDLNALNPPAIPDSSWQRQVEQATFAHELDRRLANVQDLLIDLASAISLWRNAAQKNTIPDDISVILQASSPDIILSGSLKRQRSSSPLLGQGQVQSVVEEGFKKQRQTKKDRKHVCHQQSCQKAFLYPKDLRRHLASVHRIQIPH